MILAFADKVLHQTGAQLGGGNADARRVLVLEREGAQLVERAGVAGPVVEGMPRRSACVNVRILDADNETLAVAEKRGIDFHGGLAGVDGGVAVDLELGDEVGLHVVDEVALPGGPEEDAVGPDGDLVNVDLGHGPGDLLHKQGAGGTIQSHIIVEPDLSFENRTG